MQLFPLLILFYFMYISKSSSSSTSGEPRVYDYRYRLTEYGVASKQYEIFQTIMKTKDQGLYFKVKPLSKKYYKKMPLYDALTLDGYIKEFVLMGTLPNNLPFEEYLQITQESDVHYKKPSIFEILKPVIFAFALVALFLSVGWITYYLATPEIFR